MTMTRTGAGRIRFYLLSCLMALIFTAGLNSCGFTDDDDEPESTYPLELLGVWDGVSRQISVKDAGGESDEQPEVDLSDFRVSINANGTIVGYERSVGQDWREISRGFWLYSDGRMVVSDRTGDRLYVVRDLTADRLVLSSSEKMTDESGEDTGAVKVTTDRFNRAM